MARIVQVVTQMEAGGAQRMALWLAEGLLKKGHEAEVWYLYKKRALASETVRQVVLEETKPAGIIGIILLALKLLNIIRKHRPDVFITHTHYANVLCQPLSWLLRVPCRVAVQHNDVWTYPKAARWLDLLWGTLGFYTANVGVSGSASQSVSRYPGSYRRKLQVIYNGVPRIEESPVPRDEARLRLHLPPGRFLLVNVGRLAYQKNQAAILGALSRLPEAHLAIVGDGELRDSLAALAVQLQVSDRVHFLGEVPPYKVHSIVQASDLFVFPSRYEGMPLSLLEAMQMGKPVVASNIPPNVELLGDAALFVEPEDSIDLEKKVRMLQEDGELRDALAGKAKARAEMFSLEQMVDNYERLVTAR